MGGHMSLWSLVYDLFCKTIPSLCPVEAAFFIYTFYDVISQILFLFTGRALSTKRTSALLASSEGLKKDSNLSGAAA